MTVRIVRRPSRHRRAVAVVITMAVLIITACGSQLSSSKLAATNGALEVPVNGSNAAGSVVPGDAPSAVGPTAIGTAGPSTGATGASALASGPTSAGAGTAASGSSSPAQDAAAPSGSNTPSGATPAANLAPVILGAFGDASGVLGAVSGPAPPALRAWVRYVNATGGLGGHPVKLIVADDGGDPARSLSIAQQMVEQDHVMAIFNEYTFGELDSALPYLQSKGVPVIGTIGADVTTDHSSDVFNPLVGADLGQAWGFLLTIAAQSPDKKLAILYCREAATCSVQEASFQKLLPWNGMSLVYSAQISLVQPDFTAEMIGARNAGAQVVVALADSASLIRMAQAAHRQGWYPQFSGTYNLELDATVQGGSELNGLILAAREPPYQTSPKLAAYRQAMAEYEPGQTLGDLGAGVFVVGQLLQQVVGPMLSANPTSQDFLKAMYALHDETLGGLLPGITFPQSADHTHVNECIIPIKFENGLFVDPGGQDKFACAPGWTPGT